MRAGYLALLLGAALALTGCGKPQSAEEKVGATAPVAGESVPGGAATGASVAQSPAAPAKSTVPATPQSKVTRLNEDGSETVEETSGDNGTHNPLLAAVASSVAAATPSANAAATNGPTLWQEGVNYTRLVPAQPTAVPVGQVEVLEFFWYACPHCYALDPLVESWKKNKPGFITFVRVPVLWNDGHRALARLYYTLETLGKADQLHSEIFKTIQVDGNPLVTADPADAAGTERLQAAFAGKFGISEDNFKKAYHSFAVDNAMQRADQLVQRYRVDGVPTFVINGKYVADVRTADGPEKLISLVSDLAAQEHKP